MGWATVVLMGWQDGDADGDGNNDSDSGDGGGLCRWMLWHFTGEPMAGEGMLMGRWL